MVVVVEESKECMQDECYGRWCLFLCDVVEEEEGKRVWLLVVMVVIVVVMAG